MVSAERDEQISELKHHITEPGQGFSTSRTMRISIRKRQATPCQRCAAPGPSVPAAYVPAVTQPASQPAPHQVVLVQMTWWWAREGDGHIAVRHAALIDRVAAFALAIPPLVGSSRCAERAWKVTLRGSALGVPLPVHQRDQCVLPTWLQCTIAMHLIRSPLTPRVSQYHC